MNKNLRLSALTLMASFVVASCGGGSSTAVVGPPAAPTPAPATNFVERNLDPFLTIGLPTITANDYNIAITPATSVTAANKLFVFLPGTHGFPNLYRYILQSGANRGFHTIGLNYVNNKAVGGLCLEQPSDCFLNVRTEVITGQDSSQLVDVSPDNSIVTRLTKTISYLNKKYQNEGWNQ